MYGYAQLAGNIGGIRGALVLGLLHSACGQTEVYLAASAASLFSITIFSLFHKV